MLQKAGVRMRAGFTLIETIVVTVVLGMIVAVAVPAYLKVKDDALVADGKSLLEMVGRANQMYAKDHNNVHTIGTISNRCNSAACNPANVDDSCNLVACQYLARQDWDSKSYIVAAIGSYAMIVPPPEAESLPPPSSLAACTPPAYVSWLMVYNPTRKFCLRSDGAVIEGRP